MIVRIRQIVALVFLIVVLAIALHQKVFADEYASKKLSVVEPIEALERQKRGFPIMQPLIFLMFQAEKSFIFQFLAVVIHTSYILYGYCIISSLNFFSVRLKQFFMFWRWVNDILFGFIAPLNFFRFFCFLNNFLPFFIAKLPTKVVIKKLFVCFIALFFKNRLSFCHANAGGSYDS